MRSIYETELRDIQRDCIRMCNQAQEALGDVMEAVRRRDFGRIDKITELDGSIRSMRMEINERVTRLIATQHPVAEDLRRLLYFIHVAEEMQYIGYEAEVTGKSILRTQNGKVLLYEDIYRMCERIDGMFQKMLAAVLGDSIEHIRQVIRSDDEVDVLFEQICRECIAHQVESHSREDILMSFAVVQHVEHIADRIVNWGRWYLYFLGSGEDSVLV